MKNKTLLSYLLLGLCCSVITSSLYAQEYDNSLLLDYKLPDIQRKSLDFTFNSNGNLSKSLIDDINESSVSGMLNMVYKDYKNTRKFVGNQLFIVNFDADYNKGKDYEGIKKTGYIRPSIYYSNSSRFYKNKRFFETGGKVSLDIMKGLGGEYSKTRIISTNAYVPLFIGYGRIEDVKDMRQAIYILDNLKKQGVVNRSLSKEEMVTFAQLISAVKNKRFLDSRKHLINEVTAVDSFLINSGIITNNGAKYFTTLYDYWMNGDLFERKNGVEVKAGFTPSYGISQNRNKTFKERTSSVNVEPQISFMYEKPMSLKWQHSVSLIMRYRYSKEWIKDLNNEEISGLSDTSESEKTMDYHSAEVGGEYFIGYYPNSRTNLRFGIADNFGWNKILKEDIRFRNSKTNITALKLESYYYISPQLRLSAKADLSYRFSEKDSDYYYGDLPKTWAGSYSITLTYSLF